MVLLTSRKVSGKDQTLQVVRDYDLRWKIEENFKYKKQQFSFEKIKVRRDMTKGFIKYTLEKAGYIDEANKI